MRITLRIEEKLYREAKAAAARQGVTIASFIKEALKLWLRSDVGARKGGKGVPLPTFGGGGFAYSPTELKALATRAQAVADRKVISSKKRHTSKQRNLLDLFGTIDYDADYDYKRTRAGD